MNNGTIKKSVKERGFGFIESASGPDIFFHHSGVAAAQFDDLAVGETVQFDLDERNSKRGPRAHSVVRCAAASAA